MVLDDLSVLLFISGGFPSTVTHLSMLTVLARVLSVSSYSLLVIVVVPGIDVVREQMVIITTSDLIVEIWLNDV